MLIHIEKHTSFISVSANIYDATNLDDYVSSLKTGKPNIDSWVKKTLRKYLVNDWEYQKVTKVKPKDPAWVHEALKKRQLVNVKMTGRKWEMFKMDIEHALGFFKTLPTAKQIHVNVTQAIKAGADHLRREQEQASADETAKDTTLLLAVGKYRWVNVLSKQGLQREGKLMQHCVGSEEQDYIKNVKNKTLGIWSLRDSNNNPHATIEYLPKKKSIQQIKGKQNRGVIKKYVPFVIKFLKTMKKVKKVKEFDTSELLNIGILEHKGNWLDIYNLPVNLTVDDDLDLEDTAITVLPNNLTVNGDLIIIETKITTLPKNLKVGGDLILIGTKVTVLSDNLNVGGNLDMEGTKITTLPKNLKVGGYLDMEGTKITALSKKLAVGGDLLLKGTKVTDLPDNLNVGGNLDLSKTRITALPENLTVGGDIYLNATKITSLPESLKVKGSLYLTNTRITALPDNLTVKDNLDLEGTKITVLPDNLTVGGKLYLTDTKITDIPSSAQIDTVIRD